LKVGCWNGRGLKFPHQKNKFWQKAHRGHLPFFIIYELFFSKSRGWFFLLLVTRWLRKHWDLSLGRSRKQISSFSQLKCGVCVDYFCCFLCFFIIYHIYQIFVRHLLFIIVGRRREKDRCMKKLCILATGFSFLMIFFPKIMLHTHIFMIYKFTLSNFHIIIAAFIVFFFIYVYIQTLIFPSIWVLSWLLRKWGSSEFNSWCVKTKGDKCSCLSYL